MAVAAFVFACSAPGRSMEGPCASWRRTGRRLLLTNRPPESRTQRSALALCDVRASASLKRTRNRGKMHFHVFDHNLRRHLLEPFADNIKN